MAGIANNTSVDVSLFGIIKGILFYEYCFPLWFMWQLILYVIIAPLIFWVISKKKFSVLVWFAIAAAGICGVTTLGFDEIGDGRANFALDYFAYYFTGCLMAVNPQVFDKIKGIINKIPISVIGLLYILFGILSGLLYQEYIKSFNKSCLVPLVAVCLWALFYKLCRKHPDIKVPQKVSTMIVYAIHTFVGTLVGFVLEMLPLPTIVNYIVWFILTAVISCVASMVIRLIKPVHWVLSGNR